MRDNLQFRGPLFEFKASGPLGILAAIVITLMVVLLARSILLEHM
jgi:hypothetical protein